MINVAVIVSLSADRLSIYHLSFFTFFKILKVTLANHFIWKYSTAYLLPSMGLYYSAPAQKRLEVPIFMIDFHEDQVSVFNAEDEALSVCRDVLDKIYWGIQKEKNYDDVTVFSFKSPSYLVDAKVADHRFIVSLSLLLKDLLEIGYVKLSACKMNYYSDVDVWFLCKSPVPTATRDMDFCAINLRSPDEIEILKCPQDVVQSLSFTVYDSWEQRIEKAEDNFMYSYLKLRGNPWSKSYLRNSVKSHILMMKMIQCMGSHGWILYSSCNLDGRNDTLIFCQKRKKHEQENLYTEVFTLSINRSDRLRFINADMDVFEGARNCVRDNWHGIQKEVIEKVFFEFKLAGNPWHESGSDCVHSILLLCQLFSEMRSLGWAVFTNIEMICSPTSKGVFYFNKKCPKHVNYCAISLSSVGTIYGINITEEIREALNKVFEMYFDKHSKSVNLLKHYATSWDLDVMPWATQGLSALRFNGQLLIANIIHVLVDFDYHLCTTAHILGLPSTQENRPSMKPVADTLFFAHCERPLLLDALTNASAEIHIDEVSFTAV